MDELDPLELSRQLRKPEGDTGRQVAGWLNTSNESLYDQAFGLLKGDDGGKMHLLEIGFGNGDHFHRYSSVAEQIKVIGLDFSEDMCREARSRNRSLLESGRLEVRHGGSDEIPYDQDTFHRVVALNVLYFWDPPAPHLQEIYRVLRPGGELLLGYRSRSSVEDFAFTRENFILYEPQEVEELLEEHGFRVQRHVSDTREKEGPDGEPIHIVDRCITARKPTGEKESPGDTATA